MKLKENDVNDVIIKKNIRSQQDESLGSGACHQA